MHSLFVFYLIATACSSIHTLAHAIAGRLLGAEVEEIQLFAFGPSFIRFRVHFRGVLWVLSVVPSPGGYVKFRVKGGDEFSRRFSDLPPVHRMLIMLAGSMSLVALAVACLGPIEGIHSVGSGFRQVVRGALAPIVTGAPLVRAMFDWIRLRPFPTALGIYAAKMAAAQPPAPLPPLDGGLILWNLIQWRGRFSDRIEMGVNWVGLLTTVILYCGWFSAIVHVLQSPGSRWRPHARHPQESWESAVRTVPVIMTRRARSPEQGLQGPVDALLCGR